MPKAVFCGLPHSESEVYYVKVSAIELALRLIWSWHCVRAEPIYADQP